MDRNKEKKGSKIRVFIESTHPTGARVQRATALVDSALLLQRESMYPCIDGQRPQVRIGLLGLL